MQAGIKELSLKRKRTAAELAALRQKRAEEKAAKEAALAKKKAEAAAARAQFQANYKASAKTISFAELDKDPYDYLGEVVTYRG
jgi:uncharacterized protein YdaU (DUF1376 family)